MRTFRILALLILLPGFIQAQDFTLEQALDYSFPENLTASPYGSRIAWTENHQGRRSIWVAEGPRFSGRALLDRQTDDGQAIGSLVFSHDGRYLAFVNGGGPNRSGEIPNPNSNVEAPKQEIFLMEISGRGAKLISEGSNPSFSPDGRYLTFIRGGQVWAKDMKSDAAPARMFQIRGRAGSAVWSPDGSRLAFISSRGTHAFLGIYHLADNRVEYPIPSVDSDRQPVWSPDGKQIAFIRVPQISGLVSFVERREGLPWSIWVYDTEKEEGREVWKAREGRGSFFYGLNSEQQLFWMQGDQLVFPWEGNGWLHLYAVKTAGGEARLLTPGDGEVQYVAPSADGAFMVYSSNHGDIDRQHLWRVDMNGSAPVQLTSGKGLEWSPAVTADAEVVMLVSGPRQPAYAAHLDSEGEIQPNRPNLFPGNYPSAMMVEPQQVVIKAEDGITIHNQLFLPKNYEPGKKYPALLFFHGGSRRQMYLGFHDRGYYHNAYAMNQYLASMGFIVMSVNYRSGVGYGMEFREALNYGANGASEYKDVVAAAKYLQGRSDVDASRIGLWGGSYGGYLTAMGLARNSDIFKAGVDFHGVHDWTVVIRNFQPGFNPEREAEVARRAYQSSPMYFIDGWKSPVLLIHADDDRNVPFSETVDLVEALRKRKVPYEQLIYPDDVHGFLLHRNWLRAYEESAKFLEKYLKPLGSK